MNVMKSRMLRCVSAGLSDQVAAELIHPGTTHHSKFRGIFLPSTGFRLGGILRTGQGLAALVLLGLASMTTDAATITVPNASFESPNVTGISPFYQQFPTAFSIGDWVRYTSFHAVVEGGRYGLSPTGLAGTQFGDVTGGTGGGVYQDTAPYDGSGSADLYWQAGRTYTLTVGAFLRSDNAPGPGRKVEVRLFYRPAQGGSANVLSTRTLTVGTDALSGNALTDYTVTWTVAAGAPEVGQPIGIWFTAVAGGSGATGDWGFDDLRLQMTALSALVTNFTANPTLLHAGQPTMLRWEVDAGATVSIDPGVGDVTAITTNGIGTVAVAVETNTTFTLTATKDGRLTETNQITVSVKPLITLFAATRNPIPRGAATVLSWDINPTATIFMISPDIGEIYPLTTNGVGHIAAAPLDTTTYTLTVDRNGEVAEAQLTITVTEPLFATPPDLSSIVSVWPLNGNTKDTVGPNDGQFIGTANYVLGPNPDTLAASLNGSSFITAGQNVAFNNTTPFSASAWIQAPPGQDSTIIGKMQPGGTYTGWELHVGAVGTGLLNVWLINAYGTSFIQVNSPVNVLDNMWHHVAFTYDGSSTAAGVKIYVDGADATGTVSANNLSGTLLNGVPLCLGTRQAGAAHNFHGAIHEAAVWNVALTPENVFSVFQSGAPQPTLIFSFAAEQLTVDAGQPLQLSWQVDPDATVSIDPNLGDVTPLTVNGVGTTLVTVEAATTYTLTASRDGRSETRQLSIIVRDLISSFTANRKTLPQGGEAMLSWRVNPFATAVTLSPAPGDVQTLTVDGVGSLVVSPSDTTSYMLSVERGGALMDVQLTVAVTEPVPATAPDLSSVVSLWPLNGTTLDVIGTNHGTFVNSTNFTAGVNPGSLAASLLGTNYITAGTNFAFDTATAFSVMAWIRGDVANNNSAIIGKMQHGSGYPGWELHVGAAAANEPGPGKLNVWLIQNFGSSFIQVNSDALVLDGSWHHVAFTYDGSGGAAGVKIYVDGEDATGATIANNLIGSIANSVNLCLGTRASGAAHNFTGGLAEAAVLNGALTPENIRSIYVSGVLPPVPEIRLTAPQFSAPTSFRFSWNSEVGKTYRLESSTSLPGGWSLLEEAYPAGGATGPVTSYTNDTTTAAQRFLRARSNN